VADLTALPSTLTAGDSYAITLSLSAFPASAGWAVTWTVAGPSVRTWTSIPSGDAHALTIGAADTATLEAGDYRWSLRATRSGTVTTAETGTLRVTPDLMTLVPGEAVSYWQQLKTAAEKALLALMDGNAVQMTTIMGRQTMFRSPADCQKVIAQCEQQLAAARGVFGTPIRFDVVGLR
jgi:hypothetical protein